MIRYILSAAFLFTAFVSMGNGVHAQEGADHAIPESTVKMRLVPEVNTIAAGGALWVGLEQAIHPKWHTYWKNPGDSGAEPRIAWDLPEGFRVSQIYWPAPHKIPYGPLLNYGYENNVILLQKIQAPDVLPEGPLEIPVSVDVLVCEEVCIPESADFTLVLNDVQGVSEDNAAYLNAARTRLPQKTKWDASYLESDGQVVLNITPSNPDLLKGISPEMIEAFPESWGLVDNAAKPEVLIDETSITLSQKRGERALGDIGDADFVIAIGKGDKRLAYRVSARAPVIVAPAVEAEPVAQDTTTAAAPETSSESGIGFLQALVLAFIGGVVLNLMPCVFPVLSLKAISLVKISEKNPDQARKHGLAYTAGVVLTFVAIASVLIGLKAAGAGIGWGFQLQNPLIVGGLAYLLFALGLNLFGFFEIGSSFTNFGGKFLGKADGYFGSFLTGVLATVVATPCTAPFMAAAIGYALVQSVVVSLLIFIALGFGLAFPYLLLSFMPNLEARLPKPGAWMNTFKQFMAFPMLLSAAWLVWVLSLQSGSTAVLYVLIGLVLISFAVWASHVRLFKDGSNRRTLIGLSVFIAAVLLVLMPPASVSSDGTSVAVSAEDVEHWKTPFSESALDEALKGDDPVFVEMTAAWCITCKLNHATSINVSSTRSVFQQEGVRYLLGDWTNQDEVITKYLQRYGRSGVPLYVLYGKPDENGDRPEAVILPQILTPAIVKNAIVGQ